MYKCFSYIYIDMPDVYTVNQKPEEGAESSKTILMLKLM